MCACNSLITKSNALHVHVSFQQNNISKLYKHIMLELFRQLKSRNHDICLSLTKFRSFIIHPMATY